ncbi:hypothetical protein D3C72_2239750 [compost metagenome]
MVPEANQQEGRNTDKLPEDIQLQQVRRNHQHQHGEREQRDIPVEYGNPLVTFHISLGVNVNQQADQGYDHQH